MKELVTQLMKHLGEGKTQEALNVSRQIIALKPAEPHYYYNHAMMCIDLFLLQESADAMRLAKERMPKCPIIRRLLSSILLSLGEYREGLAEGEYRFSFPLPDSPTPLAPMPIILEMGPRFRQCYPGPYWDGKTSLINKTILVFNEAGFGDIIQNVRYLPQLKAANIILDVKEDVYPILKNIQGIKVITYKKNERVEQFSQTFFNNQIPNKLNLPPYDYVVSLHTLPYYFDPDLTHIPNEFPYIFPEPSEASKIVKDNKSKLKVGIVWAGSEKHNSDDHRSIYKKDLAPLMNVPGIQLFSLQLGKMVRNWPDVKSGVWRKVNLLEGGEIIDDIDLAPFLHDFNDTAAAIKELDAVVAVDTSVGHLTGALNVPLWTILPDQKWVEWRWRPHLKWYASQKLMLKKCPDEGWEGPIKRIAKDLANLT